MVYGFSTLFIDFGLYNPSVGTELKFINVISGYATLLFLFDVRNSLRVCHVFDFTQWALAHINKI